MEDVDLTGELVRVVHGGLVRRKLTDSDVMIFGTARSISSDSSFSEERFGGAGVQANEQKFIVFTSRE